MNNLINIFTFVPGTSTREDKEVSFRHIQLRMQILSPRARNELPKKLLHPVPVNKVRAAGAVEISRRDKIFTAVIIL
jgi:hypothetical protein